MKAQQLKDPDMCHFYQVQPRFLDPPPNSKNKCEIQTKYHMKNICLKSSDGYQESKDLWEQDKGAKREHTFPSMW